MSEIRKKCCRLTSHQIDSVAAVRNWPRQHRRATWQRAHGASSSLGGAGGSWGLCPHPPLTARLCHVLLVLLALCPWVLPPSFILVHVSSDHDPERLFPLKGRVTALWPAGDPGRAVCLGLLKETFPRKAPFTESRNYNVDTLGVGALVYLPQAFKNFNTTLFHLYIYIYEI